MNRDEPLPRLVGVPRPQLDESPTSWLARTALSQGTTITALNAYLGLPPFEESDFFVLSRHAPAAFDRATLHASALLVARRMLSNLRKLDAGGGTYLLRRGNKAQYRYCAPCLLAQREKYFPIHWRFKSWQWCPLHRSIMRDRCEQCAAPLELPVSLLHGGLGGQGVPSLAYCLQCGYRLFSSAQDDCFQVSPEAADPWTRCLMINGRAAVAAMYRGHVFAAGDPTPRSIQHLRVLAAIIPTDVEIWGSEPSVPEHNGDASEDAPFSMGTRR